MKDYTNFRKTGDKNIVLADAYMTEEIYVDKIKSHIESLNKEIRELESVLEKCDGCQL